MKKYTYFLVDRNSSIDAGYSVEIIKAKSEDADKFFKLSEEVNNVYKESELNDGIFRIVAKTRDLIPIHEDDFYVTPIQELIEEIIYDFKNLDEYISKSLLDNLCKIKFQNV
ncbi:hypothetical protein EJM73_08680 [Clostridium botulinum]|uniref:hypothetical protein n=1 Tax=Clostridium botulinum TaxID=1491 RepID=UPI0013760C39|nr:hypothetical protein [Clostridium botulinum]NCI19698.1 hypothetical protein [Clostridium botulinum]NCI35736.1 hypothetical protein [Clostridium botulinum]NCI71593.1 hypothetical protein [Clostridium botulinum]NDI38785.1 hypothetical protein [Clostridium botulinum]